MSELHPAVRGMLERDAFSRWLGIEVSAAGPGRCVAAMTVREDMVNGFGVAHGAIAFALADSVLAFAANAHGRVSMSVDNAIHYHAAVRPGDRLTATATELSCGHRVAVYDVAVARGDERVASLRGTVYRTSRDHDTESND